MSLRPLSVALLLIAPLAGCGGYYQSATPFVGQGNSVKHNAAVMIIDPQPAGAANTNIDMDGQRAWVAIERYRANAVLEPAELTTTEDLPVAGDTGSSSGGASTQTTQ